MDTTSQYVSLSVSDGSSMQAYTSQPVEAGSYPGLILFQEAFGVNHHIRELTERFAAEGYLVVAPELFHRTAPPGFEAPYGDMTAVQPHFQGISERTIADDATAAWDWLAKHPQIQKGNIASTGYCMGGRASFIANTALSLKAAISYYGGRIAPDLIKRASELHGPMLFFWGGLDKHIPPEHIALITQGMREANKPFINVEFSDADHAFFCDARPNYNPQAANESWVLTLAFLKNKLDF
jgi:carboxymethylenebutenolidase